MPGDNAIIQASNNSLANVVSLSVASRANELQIQLVRRRIRYDLFS